MAAEILILGDMVDDHVLAALAHLVADGRLHLELAARLEAEGDLVAHGAGDPAILGDARNGGKTHSGRAANDLQDAGHRVDALDSGDVRRQICRHPGLPRVNRKA